jgi:hypothetical protein
MKYTIYKLIGNDNVYIGSTKEQSLHLILRKLKGQFNNYMKGRVDFQASYNCFTKSTFPKVVLVEYYESETLKELYLRKREIINETDCCNKEREIIDGRKCHKRYN